MDYNEFDSVELFLARSIFKRRFINMSHGWKKKKVYRPLWRPIEVQSESGTRFSLGKIQLLCPVCGSPVVGEFGTYPRKVKRVKAFQCKNLDCMHLKKYRCGKQFVLTTSYKFQELFLNKLKAFYEDLMVDGAKHIKKGANL